MTQDEFHTRIIARLDGIAEALEAMLSATKKPKAEIEALVAEREKRRQEEENALKQRLLEGAALDKLLNGPSL